MSKSNEEFKSEIEDPQTEEYDYEYAEYLQEAYGDSYCTELEELEEDWRQKDILEDEINDRLKRYIKLGWHPLNIETICSCVIETISEMKIKDNNSSNN